MQVGMPNLLDKGVLRVGSERGLEEGVARDWAFLDEIPFDFERRMLSVVLRPAADPKADPILVCKVRTPSDASAMTRCFFLLNNY